MTASKPRYYRFTAGLITRHSYSERYDFQNKTDTENFLAWVNGHDPKLIKDIKVEFNTITIFWWRNR
jgi:hypothetical protein